MAIQGNFLWTIVSAAQPGRSDVYVGLTIIIIMDSLSRGAILWPIPKPERRRRGAKHFQPGHPC